ncbi:3-hydroxyacyl-CoA dehydrogenase NAD-binding domain-containing protein [Paenibacillus sp. N1-5-1-14]|uniref:3-hydroxyacyl-CoA dehydrogenase family protein n=1 Tax=Paenibacillus radicibacter TaxID=2972488 RepID=UPI002158B951|nr:3-hydroxyacyl-CoA dehydrogenase NAD-binding domain-containing protein [Paenibacillus radicibacter]MCR8642238.1 3-hydroxyacyl-CoA dehydrogenase NAD-binding domain-containing protein [Paenibacillus radicibacter]
MSQFKKIGVIGGGTMGQGIAEMLAKKGLDVILVEKTEELTQTSLEHIANNLDKQLEKWAITEAEKKLILAKIHGTADLNEVATCDMIIETVSEELEVKKEVFRRLDQICPSNVILSSNTSTLSLTELAAVTKSPDRVIGVHFVHPVSKIDLVEIIRGIKTSDATYKATHDFVQNTIEKHGIQVFESPGFVTSRLICLLINEAMVTLSEGVATAEEIDTAMKIGYEFRSGPLEMADRFGLDSVLAALERMFREFGDLKYRPSFLLKQMVYSGQLGVKTGQGFFQYDKDGERV